MLILAAAYTQTASPINKGLHFKTAYAIIAKL